MSYRRIGIVADKSESAQEAMRALIQRYDLIKMSSAVTCKDNIKACENVDVIIALGGDGFMLHTLHHYMEMNIPFYGMNRGTVGFLMNQYREDGLRELLEQAGETCIHPLKMVAQCADGKTHEALAFNEVSLLRKTGQAARIQISIDGIAHLGELVADGVLVATPAGSSAYNFSVGGPILPMKANLLALTPISPFRPRRWRGALLPNNVHVRFDILNSQKRPVNATADFWDANNILSVEVYQANDIRVNLLFDRGHSLEERIIREQFSS